MNRSVRLGLEKVEKRSKVAAHVVHPVRGKTAAERQAIISVRIGMNLDRTPDSTCCHRVFVVVNGVSVQR
jgi:hypothetical protein